VRADDEARDPDRAATHARQPIRMLRHQRNTCRNPQTARDDISIRNDPAQPGRLAAPASGDSADHPPRGCNRENQSRVRGVVSSLSSARYFPLEVLRSRAGSATRGGPNRGSPTLHDHRLDSALRAGWLALEPPPLLELHIPRDEPSAVDPPISERCHEVDVALQRRECRLLQQRVGASDERLWLLGTDGDCSKQPLALRTARGCTRAPSCTHTASRVRASCRAAAGRRVRALAARSSRREWRTARRSRACSRADSPRDRPGCDRAAVGDHRSSSRPRSNRSLAAITRPNRHREVATPQHPLPPSSAHVRAMRCE